MPPTAAVVRSLLLALAIVASVATAGAAPVVDATNAKGYAHDTSEQRLTIADATLEPAAASTVDLSLTEVPDGLAGFEVTLALEGDAATVVDATYPETYALTTEPSIESDGRAVTVEAADLGDEVAPGATEVTLATLSLEGVDVGTAELRVVDAHIDADGGDAVEPVVASGTVLVESVGSDADGGAEASPEAPATGDARTGGESTAVTGEWRIVAVAAVGLGLAAAAFATLLLARRRRG